MTTERFFIINIVRILKLWNSGLLSPQGAFTALMGVVQEYNDDKESE